MIASVFWYNKGATDEWQKRYKDIYAKYPQGGFAVPAGDLVFSVVVFTIVSCVALAVIGYRRKRFEAELGGPPGVKTNTAILFVLLWICYVSLSSWKVLNPDAKAGVMVGAV